MRIVFISYHFPPIGGPGAQRSVNLVRHLAARGAEVTVVTGRGQAKGFWSPEDDGSEDSIHEAVTVVRTPTEEPRATTLRRRRETLWPRRTPFERWFQRSVESVLPTLERPDLLVAQLVPYQSATAAMTASRHFGAPWIADLLDPWALDEMWLHPTLVQRRADTRAMRLALEDAAAIVMNTEEAARRVRHAFPSLAARVHSIPSGYNAADFAGAAPVTGDGAFDIVHTGSFHTELALRHRRTRRVRSVLGGMPNPHVEFLTRTHVYLLAALEALYDDDPSLRGSIRLRLSGAMTETDRRIARRLPGTEVLGFLPHDAAVRLIRSANLLFLPMHDVPGRAGLVPTKTYEYLASGRPILAAVPDGDARDLLTAAGTATLVEPDDVAGMQAAIQAAHDRWADGIDDPSPRWDVIGRHEYAQLTDRLWELLLAVCAETARPRSMSDAGVPV